MKLLRELMNLKGRVALVTGGAGHIGLAIAEALAELGAKVVLLDINKGRCEENSKLISSKYGVETFFLEVDLTKENKVRLVPGRVLEKFSRLDILVNCAALTGMPGLKGWSVPFEEQSLDGWRKALEVNLTAVFTLVQACKKALTVSGHGSVVNISSIYGVAGPDMRLYEGTGFSNSCAYSASKGGLLQLTRWLSTVLAPDVRVNAVTPGGVWRNQPENFHKRYVERTPLRRMAKEEDIKGAVAYLVSDLSDYVTGQNLIIDGGWTVW